MGTTADKLNRLINTKKGIRQEINRAYNTEEISTSDTFNSYIQKLEEHPYYLKGLVEGTIESIKSPSTTSIGNRAFYKYSKLTSASFPNATSIGGYAFRSCNNLTEVSFPNATSIGDQAFSGCSGLTEASFPVATSTGNSAFSDCTGLTSVSFPKATSIDNYAFNGCSNLTSASIPNATSIGDVAFQLCSKLTSASFPNATSIGDNAFYSCSSLTEVSFPNATIIYNGAFSDCTGLTSASFPNATSIYNYAFSSCSSLISIYVGTNTSTVCTLSNTDAFDGCSKLTNIYVPASLVDSYKSDTYWSKYANKIKAVPQEGGGEVANKSITVTTSGIADYGWIPADSKYNVEGYDVYMSDNVGVNDSHAVMKIECVGYTELTLYIRSYAEDLVDYTMASYENADTYPISERRAKEHTRGNQQSGTALSDYTAVTYTGLSGNDIIYIVFTKDSMDAYGDDRGYVLIPKQA